MVGSNSGNTHPKEPAAILSQRTFIGMGKVAGLIRKAPVARMVISLVAVNSWES